MNKEAYSGTKMVNKGFSVPQKIFKTYGLICR